MMDSGDTGTDISVQAWKKTKKKGRRKKKGIIKEHVRMPVNAHARLKILTNGIRKE
jgi:hypothetical protein